MIVGRPEAPNQPDELWLIPVEGGETGKLDLGVKITYMSLHPNGRQIAYTCADTSGNTEIWQMSDFLPQ